MRILYTKRFDKIFKSAPEVIQQAFYERLEIFLTNRLHPLLHNHKLQGQFVGHRSINITGDWRAVFYEVSDDVLYFVTVGTHSQLYE